MREYYVVYSARVGTTNGVGRTTVTRKEPIETFRDIEAVEASLIAEIRVRQPSIVELILMSWREIKPEIAPAP